ncbi:MAG: hypothetical protein K0R09_2396, partial [Clostridiales bacterium]|nr:hypothetical protein [Clostridiales bacterium]
MMTLLKFELQKILKWKGLYIAALLLILINALYVFSTKPSTLSHYRRAYRYYKVEEGYVTTEKIRIVEEGMKELSKLYHDGIRFDEVNLGRSILYRDINTVVTQRNEYIKVISNLEYNEAKTEKEELILKLLKNVGPLDSAYYTEGWKEMTKFTWSIGYYFTIMLVLLGVSLIIPQEYSSGAYMIVNSTKESRRKLIFAKMGVVIVYTGIVATLFAVTNILTNWYIYGLEGWNVPLKYIFYDTPYNIKIWQFFFMQQLFHVLSVSILGLLTMLISIFLKKGVMSLSLGGIVFIIFNGISRLIGDKGVPGSLSFIIGDFIDLRGIFTSYKNIY